MKKAQLSFDFPLSVIIFIGLITFFLASLLFERAKTIEKMIKNEKEQKLLAISEILINDVGEPENWNEISEEEIKRIGLSNSTLFKNKISWRKLTSFISLCASDYELVKSVFGFSEDFKIIFNFSDFSLECGKKDLLPLATISRIAFVDTPLLEDKIVKIRIMLG